MLFACQQKEELSTVSVSEFSKFVTETAYQTDAERYGWSIVQEDVFKFRTENGANWRKPNAKNGTTDDMPVTQVSYNDAQAYCQWAKVRLPSYKEYWQQTANDKRKIHQDANLILPIKTTNIVGNVWDITTTENSNGEIRLAGGSYLCNTTTCKGTNPKRVLFVDKETGNIHIGFSVMRNP